MQLKRYSIETAAAWIALSGWLLLLSPKHTPIYLVIVPFFLLYIALYRLWLVAGCLWRRLTGLNEQAGRPMRQLGKLVSLFICFLAVLSSLGQLVARDVVTLFLLFAVGYFYVVRSNKRDSEA